MPAVVTSNSVAVRAHWNECWRNLPVPRNASAETLRAVGAAGDALVIAARREKEEALAELRERAIEELKEVAPDIENFAAELPSLFPDYPGRY